MKFLGDAVMYVAPTVPVLARIACALVTHPKPAEAALEVRAGVAYGDVLAQDGDYFGPPGSTWPRDWWPWPGPDRWSPRLPSYRCWTLRTAQRSWSRRRCVGSLSR